MGRHKKGHGHCKALNKRTGKKHAYYKGRCVTKRMKHKMVAAAKKHRKHKH